MFVFNPNLGLKYILQALNWALAKASPHGVKQCRSEEGSTRAESVALASSALIKQNLPIAQRFLKPPKGGWAGILGWKSFGLPVCSSDPRRGGTSRLAHGHLHGERIAVPKKQG